MNNFFQFSKPQRRDSIKLMVERFHSVFEAHNLDFSQVPRLISPLKYEDLESPKRLLAALTPAAVDATAALFGVRGQWLHGQDDMVYDLYWKRKYPKDFLMYFGSFLQPADTLVSFPLRLLTTTKKLDRQSNVAQLLLPVIVEAVGSVGGDSIYRARVSGDYYDWTDSASRLDLKAIALVVYQQLRKPIPLIQVSLQQMEKISSGLEIPSMLFRKGLITTPSLEDFVMTRGESFVAREEDELPALMTYMAQQGLTTFTFEAPGFEEHKVIKHEFASTPAVPTSVQPTMVSQRKPGKRQVQKDIWADIVGAAQAIWTQDDTVTITAMTKRLQAMLHLKARTLGESAIRKHIQAVAPPAVRGKPGRKPKQST